MGVGQNPNNILAQSLKLVWEYVVYASNAKVEHDMERMVKLSRIRNQNVFGLPTYIRNTVVPGFSALCPSP